MRKTPPTSAIFRAGLLALLLTASAQGQTITGRSIGPVCNEGTGTPPLALAWRELPVESSIASLSAPIVHLSVTNNTTTTLRVRVRVAGALDAVRKTLEAGEVVVKAKSTVVLAVNLAAFQYDLGTLRFSGRLVAKGIARRESGGPVAQLAYSPHAYVHPQGGGLVAYRSGALLQQFGAGDFAGRAPELRRWAAGRGLRLSGIGILGAGLALTDDDGGPQEGTTP